MRKKPKKEKNKRSNERRGGARRVDTCRIIPCNKCCAFKSNVLFFILCMHVVTTLFADNQDEILEKQKESEREAKLSSNEESTVTMLVDSLDDSMYDPYAIDPSCDEYSSSSNVGETTCWEPPSSTMEYESVVETVTTTVPVRDGSSQVEMHQCSISEDNADANVINCTVEEVCNAGHNASASITTDDPYGRVENGGPMSDGEGECTHKERKQTIRRTKRIDKHWGSDEAILKLRDALRAAGQVGGGVGYRYNGNGRRRVGIKNRDTGNGSRSKSRINEQQRQESRGDGFSETSAKRNTRPPIFLMPGLAATRLVSWSYKACPGLSSDIRVQDYVWMKIAKIFEIAGTLDTTCWKDCVTLGRHQTDSVLERNGCKVRPDEGLDAISSLAPGGITSNMFVGGTNTVYAWLTQWLADNLGYDVASIVGLPYDWRLSPDVMEGRDGFLTLTRKRIEAAVASNGAPGIVVAHSMGNTVFRYFLEWLRVQFKEEAYDRYVESQRAQTAKQSLHEHPGWVAGLKAAPTSSSTIPSGEAWHSLAESVKLSVDSLWEYYVKGSRDRNERRRKDSELLDSQSTQNEDDTLEDPRERSLWDLAEIEGDLAWTLWLENHIWTYVGLSAPLLGAMGSLRAVLSGENMGLPMSEQVAREIEMSFGSTHSTNLISTKMGFCDNDSLVLEKAAGPLLQTLRPHRISSHNLACLDELVDGIERRDGENSWKDFDALRYILKDRIDWDSVVSPILVLKEECETMEKPPCKKNNAIPFGPLDIQSGALFGNFSEIWHEKDDPLAAKREQLEESWWSSPFPNILNTTWHRPPIKHIVMAYGVDVPTEVGYVYKKTERIKDANDVRSNFQKKMIEPNKKYAKRGSDEDYDSVPSLHKVIWEEANGKITEESGVASWAITDTVLRKKSKKEVMPTNKAKEHGRLHHSGDGTIAYISLAWAHTWLLHAARAMLHSLNSASVSKSDEGDNALDRIKFSYRPKGGSEWVSGRSESSIKGANDSESVDTDTGTSHPHGTKYKPEMRRFQSDGKSRTTGKHYTTAVIEAIGVEHKETTRNYDILAAAFTDILKYMHEDLRLV